MPTSRWHTRHAQALLACVVVLVGLSACVDAPRPFRLENDEEDRGGTAPVRRLTNAEYTRTVRDLLPGISLPALAISDGQPPPGSGAVFDGDVRRQTPADLVIEQFRAAAQAVSEQAMHHPELVLARLPSDVRDDQRAAGREWVATFGPRALRRPFEGGELARYTDLFDAFFEQEEFLVAVELTLQAFLQAPSFVYRVELTEGAAVDDRVAVVGYDMASRLSYFLWGSMPDDELFAAASQGLLDSEAGVEAAARRMLADPKAHEGVLSFHRQWLDLDRVLSANKDPAHHPTYNAFLRESMREEADRFIVGVVFGGDARLHTLLTSRRAPVNAALAALYGVPAPRTPWQFVELPGNERSGILTQAQFLAARAHAADPAPVLRGVFVLQRLLCEAPPAPAAAIDTTPPDANAAPTTNRERFAQHTSNPACQSCHVSIDGVGFGLENYDAIGGYRTTDNGLTVDASGSLEATAVGRTYTGGVELAALLAESPAVRSCAARHWFRYAVGRNEGVLDEPSVSQATSRFDVSGGNIQSLIVELTKTPAFRTRPRGH